MLRRRREFLPKVVISAQLVGFRAGSPPFLEPVSLMAANHEKEKTSQVTPPEDLIGLREYKV